MLSEQIKNYGLPLLFISFLVWRFFRFRSVRGKIPEMIQKGGVVIDVRSRGEFASGSSVGSINIPLDEFNGALDQFTVDQPIVLCCASGSRSGIALLLLKKRGFKNVINAGPWKNTVL